MRVNLADGYRLLHEGTLALSRVERNGIRVDTAYLDAKYEETTASIKEKERRLKKHETYKIWKKAYGDKMNLGSRPQLGHVLFKIRKFPYPHGGKPERYKVDESTLSYIKDEFVQDYLGIEKLKKAKSTYIQGIRREVVDGLLHPMFGLNMAVTYRSNCEVPNFQNIPIRNKEVSKLVRSAFIPRKGHILLELDYSGIEVRVAACLNKDPVLIEYILDKTKDMHRDMAMECYMLTKEQVDKDSRYNAKNKFVFPQFYGDWYKSCAAQLWEAIEKMHLKTADKGVPLSKHLRRKGIDRLGECDPKKDPVPGTFEYHIKEVEDHFWNERFQAYTEWKNDWYRRYRKRGYFEIPTGFRCSGLFSRKETINYPIQGAAFHCLLWSLIRLNKWLLKHKMRSMIVGQIHDSIILDVHKKEYRVVLQKAREIMTQELLKYWDWIIVPLEIEAEASDVNWFLKEKVEFDG